MKAAPDAGVFHCRNFNFPLGKKTYIMGILNVTPDSFSDGGKYFDAERAVERACAMVAEGVDIIDIGGESTRPGFYPVEAGEETRRVVSVVEKLARKLDIPLSIDTTKAPVARKALEAGAHIINDIWGLQKEPELARIAAEFDAGVIAMHNSNSDVYEDIMAGIITFLRKSAGVARQAGLRDENIVLDPGIGFGKTLEGNLETMRRLGELRVLGLPVLLGPSRKSMIGKVLDLPVDERIEGTAAAVAVGIACGVDFIRVHDVGQMRRVARMTDAIVRT
jgi:dihydropteroate synthase